jgi:hypothetical protein
VPRQPRHHLTPNRTDHATARVLLMRQPGIRHWL